MKELSAPEDIVESRLLMKVRSVGAVVIGRNEGSRLIACLQSLAGRASPLIYVDSGSTDGSPTAAERLGALVVSLDLSRPFTAARARNAGFATLTETAAGTEFIQFVDGDCELSKDWLDVAVSLMSDRPDVAVVCGRRREQYPNASIFNRLCDIEWATPSGEADACGGDSLVRAKALASVGGFNSDLMAGEEPELCSRLRGSGWKIWRLDAEMTVHDAAMTSFFQWWRRGVRSGYGYAQVWSATRRSPESLYGPELARAMLWGGVLPVLILFAALIHSAATWLALAYPLQIARIAFRRGVTKFESWAYAGFIVLAKFAELQGALKYFRSSERQALIEYKAR